MIFLVLLQWDALSEYAYSHASNKRPLARPVDNGRLCLDLNPLPLLAFCVHLSLDLINILNTDNLVSFPPRFQVFHRCDIVAHCFAFFVEGLAEVSSELDELSTKGSGGGYL